MVSERIWVSVQGLEVAAGAEQRNIPWLRLKYSLRSLGNGKTPTAYPSHHHQ
jgi:hypothetical protein